MFRKDFQRINICNYILEKHTGNRKELWEKEMEKQMCGKDPEKKMEYL